MAAGGCWNSMKFYRRLNQIESVLGLYIEFGLWKNKDWIVTRQI